jgi:hypothetical protein
LILDITSIFGGELAEHLAEQHERRAAAASRGECRHRMKQLADAGSDAKNRVATMSELFKMSLGISSLPP